MITPIHGTPDSVPAPRRFSGPAAAGPGQPKPGDTTQLALVLPGLVSPDYSRALTLPERFEAFHAANPHVAHALELLAGQWLHSHQLVSMAAMFERLRWESGIVTEGSAYKLDNSFRAFYSRLLMDRRPEWRGRIPIRVQKAAA